jgi:peptide/nickel transport system ATP-binding protein
MSDAPLIELSGLSVGFTGRTGVTRAVIRDIDLAVRRGESVGIVGESGSGKSTLALAAMGYLKRGLRRLAGEARFRGQDLFALAPDALQAVRGGRLALIPQNSGQALSPNLRVSAQLAEALELHGGIPPTARSARIVEMLRDVRLPDPEAIARRYPHELSGGQQQRVAIAMALAGEPEALLLDEPTTGLDVTTQAHILELLVELAARRRMAMVYVSHDLGAIARVCDRVVVMYAGEIVLDGATRDVLAAPVHPYARGLLESILRLARPRLPSALEGRPPAPGDGGPGCAFAPRCALAAPHCAEVRPTLEPLAGGGRVRCHRHAEAQAMAAPAAAPRRASDATARAAEPLLALDALSISYARPRLVDRFIGRGTPPPATVDRVAIKLAAGEALGLVGESGSGKSTILKAIAGLLAPSGGAVHFARDGALPGSVERRSPAQLRAIQLVFQNPDESLNPRHTIAEILAQPLTLYFGLTGETLRARSIAALEQVRLGPHYLERLPSQLSGGERQRVAIARAFAAEPHVVLCDEVTSALDVSVQAAVLDLLDRLRREQGTAYVFVSHDLAVVRALADRVAVLYQGRLCEIGPVAAVYARPCHPYTEALLAAVLEPEPGARPRLLADDVAELSPPARGCPFQRRCHRSLGAQCNEQAPPPRDAGDGHVIHCHLSLDALAASPPARGAAD